MDVEVFDSRKIQGVGTNRATKTISIPNEIVEKLGIEDGDEFLIALYNSRIILIPFDEFVGLNDDYIMSGFINHQ